MSENKQIMINNTGENYINQRYDRKSNKEQNLDPQFNDDQDLLEQELNYFFIKRIEQILPFLNEKSKNREEITIQDIINELKIEINEVKKCNYIFKRGVKANQRCNNICLDEKEICAKCQKISKDKVRTIELTPVQDNIYRDSYGILYRKNEDETLEVINKDLLDEKFQKRKIKLKNLGIIV